MAKIMNINRLRMGTDGKGMTTLVLFHGCPLNCEYCLNKECKNVDMPCVCISPQELYQRVKMDDVYFRMSGGGVTFGGGEPLLNSEYIAAFSKLVPKEWRLRVETSLFVPWEKIAPLVDVIDQWYIDIKDADDAIYYSYTGQHNDLLKRNCRKLAELAGKEKIQIRIPRISGYNSEENVNASVAYYEKYGKIEVFDYRLYKKGRN